MNPMEVCKMYFPYLRGRQFELIALRELLEGKRISEKVIPIIEPVKPSSTLLKTLETFVKNDREIAVVFNPTVGDFAKKLKEMREEDSKVANELYDLLTQNDKVIKSCSDNLRCIGAGRKCQYFKACEIRQENEC